MRESELPVCRTRGMNLVAAVLGEVSNHYINNTLVQISALQYTLWRYNTHISATNSAMLSILDLPHSLQICVVVLICVL